MMKTQGFIFVSSPNAVTPYHFDPEHNILLQLAGEKTMTVFPAGDPRFAPDRVHETYHTGGGRELRWRDELAEDGAAFHLAPGDALYVPVMAPHHVKKRSRAVDLAVDHLAQRMELRGSRRPRFQRAAAQAWPQA